MESLLLVSKDSTYLVEVSERELHTKDGVFKLKELKKKKFGGGIKTHLGKKFRIVKPNIIDVLEKRLKRINFTSRDLYFFRW